MAKVLVAEDDAFLSSLLVRDLQANGFDARAAYDGVQTLEENKSWHPDIILLDILMPNKDGYEVLEEMHADKEAGGGKVVILSNLGETENFERVKKYNVTGYLVKADTTPHEVVAKIKDYLV